MKQERLPLPQAREAEFARAKESLGYQDARVYRLDEQLNGLPRELPDVVVLEPGKNGHYGPVFAHIIEDLENNQRKIKVDGVSIPIPITSNTVTLVETSTGNAKDAFVRAADYLGYECVVVMPSGLPEARYRLPEQDYLQGQPEVIRADSGDYALGMTTKLRELLATNPERVARGDKPYYCLNHAVSAADTTVRAMSKLGEVMAQKIHEKYNKPLGDLVVTMGNGASVCALGLLAKEVYPDLRITAIEALASGWIYDLFAQRHGLESYWEKYGMKPGSLMPAYTAYGSTAPMKEVLPLQIRAIDEFVHDFELITDRLTNQAYKEMSPQPSDGQRALIANLPDTSTLPPELHKFYGNTALMGFVEADKILRRNKMRGGERKLVGTVAYDLRDKYS